MSRCFRLLSCLVLVLSLSACAGYSQYLPRKSSPDVELSALIDKSAARMLRSNSELLKQSPVIAASFVNIDSLTESSTLGRLTSELFASALAREGMLVREVKMRDSLFIEENVGELILSREVQRLSAAHAARSILIGTYAVGQSQVYISVRLVRTSDSFVLGATDLRLPLNANVQALLGGGVQRW
ncbi:FlgO family outer membrane protein [Geopseudomonas guangdongensis]|uniref:FlgO domain-containing protein n=1 Tax=Geopseudomonas guangdongensis TaxID=1245526 RepID=A0A1H2E6L8_9GAMM|nr:FlgO family outer membrane protein [Pseudomonas guangdongensis]SDT90713.1 hypothetical protein SAMN05216580_0342 [Pseudomonas guangdongensis]